MCCLAYERGLYVETLRDFPRVGSRVRTATVEGKAVKADIFTRTITIRTSDDDDVRIAVEELEEEMRDGKWVPRPGRKADS